MRIDKRLTVVLAVSVLWALLVTAIFTRVGGGSRSPRAAGPEKPLVVAARALPLGSMLARDTVKLRSIPEKLFPAGGFSRLEDVIDRPVISPIQAEEAVLEARIAARGSGSGLAPMIPPGMRAISVRVNDVVGVAGFVLPGMRVDVLVTGKPTMHPDTVTRTVLQNIVVLSAGQTIESDGKSAISTPVVTLLVSPADAESLTLAISEGHIQLVLRNSADEVLANPRGRQLNDMLALPSVAAKPAEAPPPPKEMQAVRRPRPSVTPGIREVAPQPAAVAIAVAPPAAVEQVLVIRGNVKTIERAAKGGEK